jgi:all-trans-retinol 13,14-reductase
MEVVIIGAGMGGLFCGALLAKRGIRVTVLEKNSSIGGGLQTFVRGGETYETGMHVAGGFNEGGILNSICRYLGIMDRLRIRRSDLMLSVRYADSGRTYNLPAGRDAFVDYLSGLFPHEKENIRQYVDAVFRISHEEKLFYLESLSSNENHSPEFFMPADAFIAKYVNDTELRALLAAVNPLYSGIPGHSPAYIHIMISALFMENPCWFEGGSGQLAEALKSVIEDAGGRVMTRCEVGSVRVSDMNVEYVADKAGNEYRGDWYISDIHPCSLIPMIDGKAFTTGYCNRIESIPDTASAFKVFIKLKPGTVRFPGHPVSVIDSMDNTWKMARYETGEWPHGANCFFAEGRDGWASHMTVYCLMNFEEVKEWESTRSGHRGESYETWKKERTERVLALVEKIFPGIREAADDIFASSPLTFRDWMGTRRAGAYGLFKDCANMAASIIPIKTKVRNLLLTGQNVNMHGIGGVPMTAIETIQTIFADDSVLNGIKEVIANK